MEQNEKGLDMFPFYVVVVGGKNIRSANSSGSLQINSPQKLTFRHSSESVAGLANQEF
jgi:hypothetical protein